MMGLAEKSTPAWTQQLKDLLQHDRTIKKYTCILYLVNYLHYVWTAQQPSLTYQKSHRAEAIVKKCSLLVEKYHPSWYLLNNGHLHTIMLAKLTSHPLIHYERQMVPMSDGGVVSLDWAVPPGVDPDGVNVPDIPTVIIFHGLTGGSGDNYVCVTVEKLVRDGWRVVVMNARGCANTPLLTPQLFCGAYTDDVRQVVAVLRRDHVPSAPLVSVGFSLGSNIMVKYIGEEGAACPLTAAVSVGNPYDFMCNSRNLNHSFVHNAIYNAPLATNLNNLFFVRSNAHEVFADHPEIDLAAVQASSRVIDFDEQLTRRAFGYASVSDYYRDASSSQYLKHVRIPLLLLSAKDDPICIHTATPYDDVVANDNLMLAVTDTGGHLGFFTGNSLLDVPDMWSANVVAQFCNAIVEITAPDGRKPSIVRRLFQSADQTALNPPQTNEANPVEPGGVDVEGEDQVSLRRVAAALVALAAVHLAIKHRHAVRKKWWY